MVEVEMSYSLAIMTDAAHLLSDVSGFGVAIFATLYAARSSHSTHTFGYGLPHFVFPASPSQLWTIEHLSGEFNHSTPPTGGDVGHPWLYH